MTGGGLVARGGFDFQDLLLGVRLVRHIAARLAARIAGAPTPPEPVFSVESSPHAGPATAPDWDLVEEYAAGTLVFEEAKGGGLGKGDREILWRRLRETAAAHPARQIVPRLTVNRDNLPGGVEHFRGLSGAIATAKRFKQPPPGNVTSAAKLAEEALYWLTRPRSKAAPTKPMTEAVARAMLGRFELFESPPREALRAELESELAKLTRSVGVDVVVNAVQGELWRRAANPDASVRTFGPSALLVQLELVAALLRTSDDAFHLWADLRVTPARPSPTSSPLAYQNWREVQPDAALQLDDPTTRRVALVGRGGLGKTVLLERFADEARSQGQRSVVIDGRVLRGASPSTIAQALALGRFEAMQAGTALTLLVDAFESAADSTQDLADVAAGLARAEPDLPIVLAVRDAEWRALSRTSAAPQGWTETPIAEWTSERVERLVSSSARPTLSPELLRLLTTPLFLDLFLRLFGTDKPVPPGLQTRHGLLREYWHQRVLPDDHPEAPARRRLLDDTAQEEAAGRDAHNLPPGAAADTLTSEGIFRGRDGRHLFRHTLLRDFAVMQWLLAAGSGNHVADNLARIPRLLVRMGAIRAVLEAVAEGPAAGSSAGSAPGILHALGAHDDLGLLTADALAELDDPSTVDLLELLRGLSQAGAPLFERLAEVGRLRGVKAWAARFAQLPDTSAWAEGETWLRAAGLQALADFAETVQDDTIGLRLARRVRAWSNAPKLTATLDANDGWLRAHVIRAVVARAPELETVSWLDGQATHARVRVRSAVVDGLASLASRVPIDPDHLRTLFRSAASLDETDGALRVRAGQGPWHFDALRALAGTGRQPGLLQTNTEAILPVVFALMAGRATGRAAADSGPLESVDSFLLRLGAPELDAADRALFASAPPPLTPIEAFGDLLLDVEDALSLRLDSTWASLVAQVRELVERGSLETVRAFAAAAFASVSLFARLILLTGATARLSESGFDAIVDTILADQRLYYFHTVTFAINRALAARWPSWDTAARQSALDRLRAVVRAPSVDRIFNVAPLLVAIPESDWPSDLRPFVESYRRRFGDPEPLDPNRPRRALPRSVPGDEILDRLPPVSQPDGGRLEWMDVERGITLAQRYPEFPRERLGAAIERASAALPAPNDPPGATTWCASRLVTAVQLLHEAAIPLSAPLQGRVADWTLTTLSAIDPGALNADRAPVGQGLVAVSLGTTPLDTVLSLAFAMFDAGALAPDGATSLLQHAERLLGDAPSPLVARSFTTHVSRTLWATRDGRRLFHQLARAVADGDALAWSLPVATDLSHPEQAVLFEQWLTGEPALGPAPTILSDHLGRWMAGAPPGPVARLRDRVMRSPPQTGLLASVLAFRHFLGGIVAGCADGLDHDGPVSPLAGVLADCWAALARTTPQPRERSPNFALLAFRPLDRSTPARAPLLWADLAPIALSIVAGGSLADIADLLFSLSSADTFDKLGPAILLPVGQRLAGRITGATTLDRDDWAILPARASEFAGRLGRAPSLPEASREQMLVALQVWSAPPLSWSEAVQHAIRVRRSFG
jgi:hypothetical protein